MKVLLDTCVLSELRRSDGDPRVRKAVEDLPDSDLYVSVLTVGEIINWIALLPPGKKKHDLQQWIQGLEQRYGDRILPIDSDTGRSWGEITARARAQGITLPAVDGLIAATAVRHGLHLMTRNTSDFAVTGVLLINPWEDD
jgi:predicted nucleic acid-binding protein